jgi:hypothetical protein
MTYELALVVEHIRGCVAMEAVPGTPLLLTVALTAEQVAILEVALRQVYAQMRQEAAAQQRRRGVRLATKRS